MARVDFPLGKIPGDKFLACQGMSGLCGWFDPERARTANPQVIASMAEAITRFGGSAVRSACAPYGAVASSAASGDADIFQGDDQLVAVWGCPRFVDKGVTGPAQRKEVARSLAQGYARNGTQVLTALTGAFALAILDGRNGKALLAVDRMGTRSLCYTTAPGKLVFGSTLDAISAFPGIDCGTSRQAIYDYVYFHMVPAPQTIYTHRQRLLPGTFVVWENGRLQTAPYWEMRFTEDEKRPFPELKERFVALVRKGVADSVQGDRTGAFLSGGTDSSTVTGMLREVTGEAPRTYSIGFEAQGFDEMGYARIAARHFSARHHEYYVTPDDVVGAIPRIAAVHDQPFGNSSAVPAFYCAKLAGEDGISTLLGGDGGDELFGGNARYATQYLYSLYSDLPQAVRKGIIEPALSVLPAAGIFGKVQRYIASASLPMPARYDNYNLLERLGPTAVFTDYFLDTVNRSAPASNFAEAYRASHARSLINKMLALDLKYTLADNDLPKVTRSCELAGVDVRFPLLHDDLVAFSARLPANQKLRGTRLRYFFKQALNGFLPDEIINKTKHGFGLPFGTWLESHPALRQIALESLTDLKKRQVVRAKFIDELTAVHVKNHPQYYGTMVWVLMMLEQWLKQHRISLN